MKRTAGILLPISSLPSRHGIGCFSKSAYHFVDWLKEAGQTFWQILPLGPTGYGDSPYQSFSTFAGNPYFISLDTLVSEGLLAADECDSTDFGYREDDIDYKKLYDNSCCEKPIREAISPTIRHTAVSRKKMPGGSPTTLCLWPSKTTWAASPGRNGPGISVCVPPPPWNRGAADCRTRSVFNSLCSSNSIPSGAH